MVLTLSLNTLRSRSRQFLISFPRIFPSLSTMFVNGSETPNDQNVSMATGNYAARRRRLIRGWGPQVVTQSNFQNGGENVPDVCGKSDPSWSSLFLPKIVVPHAALIRVPFSGSKDRPECYFPEDVFCCFCMDGVRIIRIGSEFLFNNSITGADSNSTVINRTTVSSCIWLLPILLSEKPRFHRQERAISSARP